MRSNKKKRWRLFMVSALLMLALAAGQPEKGYVYPQHHPKVRFDEDALVNGSAVYAYMAMRWLSEHR